MAIIRISNKFSFHEEFCHTAAISCCPKTCKSIFLLISSVDFGSLVIALHKMGDYQQVKELFEIIFLSCNDKFKSVFYLQSVMKSLSIVAFVIVKESCKSVFPCISTG